MAPTSRVRCHKCEICGLRTGRKNNEQRKFMSQFPLNDARCKIWVKMTGNEDLAYLPIEKLHQLKYLCGDHFTVEDFNRQGTRLKIWAVPSQNLRAPPLSDDVLLHFPFRMVHKGAGQKQQDKPSKQPNNAQEQDITQVEQAPNLPQAKLPGVNHDHNYAPCIPDQDAPVVDQCAPDVDQDAPDVDQGAPDMDQDAPDAVLESPCPSPEVVEESKPLPVPCKKCGQHIEGYRFACVSCVGCALCAACIVDGAHAACYVLRVPPRRPLSEVRAVLRACRDALAMERFADDLGGPLADEGPIQVKSESEHSDEEYDDVNKESFCEVMVRGDMDDNMDPLTSPTPAPSVGMPMVLSIEPNAAGGFILNTNTETVEPETDEAEYQVEALDSDFEEDTQSVSDDVYVPEESDEVLESPVPQTTMRLHSIQKESESNHPAMRGKTYGMRPRVLNQPNVSDSVPKSPQKTTPKVSREKRITTLAGSSLPLGPRGERTMVPVLTRLPIGSLPSLPRGERNPIYSGATEYKEDDVESQTEHNPSDSDDDYKESDDSSDASESQKTIRLQKRPKIIRQSSTVPPSVSKYEFRNSVHYISPPKTAQVSKTVETITSNNQQAVLETSKDNAQKSSQKDTRKVYMLKGTEPGANLLLGPSKSKSKSLVLIATKVPSGSQPSLKPLVIKTENTMIFTRKRTLERNDPSAPSATRTGSRSSTESAQAKRAIFKIPMTGLS